MQEFSRNPDKEKGNRPFVWEHAEEDVEIVIASNDRFFDVFEKAGGYVNHQIAKGLLDLSKAVSKAESYMKDEDDSNAK